MSGMASYLNFGALWNLFMTVVIGYFVVTTIQQLSQEELEEQVEQNKGSNRGTQRRKSPCFKSHKQNIKLYYYFLIFSLYDYRMSQWLFDVADFHRPFPTRGDHCPSLFRARRKSFAFRAICLATSPTVVKRTRSNHRKDLIGSPCSSASLGG